MIYRVHLVLPYATSDWYTSFAVFSLAELLEAIQLRPATSFS